MSAAPTLESEELYEERLNVYQDIIDAYICDTCMYMRYIYTHIYIYDIYMYIYICNAIYMIVHMVYIYNSMHI